MKSKQLENEIKPWSEPLCSQSCAEDEEEEEEEGKEKTFEVPWWGLGSKGGQSP